MQIFFLESPKSVILQMCVYCVLASTYASHDVMDSRVIDQRETFSPAHSVRVTRLLLGDEFLIQQLPVYSSFWKTGDESSQRFLYFWTSWKGTLGYDGIESIVVVDS